MCQERCLGIVGAGEHGRVIADLSLDVGQYQKILFFDDSPKPAGSAQAANLISLGEWVGPVNALVSHADLIDDVIVGIGDNKVRLSITQYCQELGLNVATFIHPSAQVSSRATIGDGSVVFANAIVNVAAVLDSAVIINSGAIVEHDVRLGDGVHLSPGAVLSGHVSVGSCSWIGAGAVVRQGCSIGANSVVGAGAAVITDLADGVLAVGVPAKVTQALHQSTQ